MRTDKHDCKVGRTATVRGSTGTAFAISLQTSIAQVGGIVSPQMFRTKYPYNRYKLPFGICAGVIILSVVANAVTWWLTAESEREVRRVRKLAIRAEREGKRHAEA